MLGGPIIAPRRLESIPVCSYRRAINAQRERDFSALADRFGPVHHGRDMEWFPRVAVLVGPCMCLGAGCGVLLGFSDDYRLRPEQVGDAAPEIPMDGGLDAATDSAVPDAMVDAAVFAMPAGKLVYHRYTEKSIGGLV